MFQIKNTKDMNQTVDAYLRYATFFQKLTDPIQTYYITKLFPSIDLPPELKKSLPLLKNKKFLHIIKQLTELTIEQLSTPTNSNNK